MFCSTPIEGTPRPKTTDNTIFKKKLFREIHPRFRFLTDLSLHGGVAAQQLLHAAVGQRQLLLDVQVRLHRHRRRRLRVVRRRRRRHLQQPHLSPPSKNVSHGIQGGGEGYVPRLATAVVTLSTPDDATWKSSSEATLS